MSEEYQHQILGYECPIKNVTGNSNVKIQNKNLAWNGWAEDFVSRINNSELANLETYENRNCLRYNAGAGSGDYDNKYIFKINWKENTQYTLSYYAKSTQGYLNLSIEYTDGTTSSIDGTPITNWAKVTLSSTANKTIKYIRARFTAGATYIDLDTFMVEENSTATDFVPHQEQNLPFTFAEGQRGMEGTTLEDDGIHNNRARIIFDGSEDENWSRSNSLELFYTSDIQNLAKQNGNYLCNYFTKVAPTATLQNGQTKYSSATNSLLQFKNTDITTVSAWREWLSTHNLIVEYELADSELESNIIPYNSTQQAQYEAIKQARSYDDQTNISSTSTELGFNMDVESLANANNMISTINSRLDLLEG